MGQDKRILISSILFILILYSFMFYAGSRITRILSPEDEEIREEHIDLISNVIAPSLKQDELGAHAIDRDREEKEEEYLVLEKKYKRIPRFRKPRHNMLSREQVDKTNNIYLGCVDLYREFRDKHLRQKPGFFKSIVLSSYMPAMADYCAMNGYVEQGISKQEYKWSFDRMNAAALFACNAQWELQAGTEEELERLKIVREQLSYQLGLYESSLEGETYFPENLDTDMVPRCNVELFLEDPEKFNYVRIKFNNINFDRQYVLDAAQSLAPCSP